VHHVVRLGQRPAQRGDRERDVEHQFRGGWTDPDAAQERRAPAPEDPEARQRDVLAEGIGDEVDGMPELEQGADPVVLAERRAAGLEERLRGDHQDAHAWRIEVARHAEPGPHDRLIVGTAAAKVNALNTLRHFTARGRGQPRLR
jgi:hypothetical protein